MKHNKAKKQTKSAKKVVVSKERADKRIESKPDNQEKMSCVECKDFSEHNDDLTAVRAAVGLHQMMDNVSATIDHDPLHPKKYAVIIHGKKRVSIDVPVNSDVICFPMHKTAPPRHSPRPLPPQNALNTDEEFKGINKYLKSKPPPLITTSKQDNYTHENILTISGEERALQYWRDMQLDREKQKTHIIEKTGKEASSVLMCKVLPNGGIQANKPGTTEPYFWIENAVSEDTHLNYMNQKESEPPLTSTTRTGMDYLSPVHYEGTREFYPTSGSLYTTGQPILPRQDSVYILSDSSAEEPEQNTESMRTAPKEGYATTKHPGTYPRRRYFIQQHCDTRIPPNKGVMKPKQLKVRPNKLEYPLSNFPSMWFGGIHLRWRARGGKFGSVEAEVGNSGYVGEQVTSKLLLRNTGTSVIFYDWQKVKPADVLNLKHHTKQRFYFDNQNGVLLPGDTNTIAVIFKSAEHGVFTEMWKFTTRPKLCGEDDVFMRLWGVAEDRDVNRAKRLDIEVQLKRQEAWIVCRNIVEKSIRRVTEEISRRRMDRKLSSRFSDEHTNRINDHFHAINPHYYYHSGVIEEVMGITRTQSTGLSLSHHSVQMICFDVLSKILIAIPDAEEDERELLMAKLSSCMSRLSFPVLEPIRSESYTICRCLFSLVADEMAILSMRIAHITERLPLNAQDGSTDDVTGVQPPTTDAGDSSDVQTIMEDPDTSDSQTQSADDRGTPGPQTNTDDLTSGPLTNTDDHDPYEVKEHPSGLNIFGFTMIYDSWAVAVHKRQQLKLMERKELSRSHEKRKHGAHQGNVTGSTSKTLKKNKSEKSDSRTEIPFVPQERTRKYKEKFYIETYAMLSTLVESYFDLMEGLKATTYVHVSDLTPIPSPDSHTWTYPTGNISS